MRKIVLVQSVTLDGFFEGPDHDLSWSRVDEELHTHFNELLAGMGGLLEGRRTYELMAEVWPTIDDDPEATPAMREFGPIWLATPKIVYSTTLTEAAWNATIARSIDVDEVKALKARPGGDLVVGGAEVAAEFIRLGLVDEYRVYVHPVMIGHGTRAFRPASVALELLETRTFGNGVVLLRYRADSV